MDLVQIGGVLRAERKKQGKSLEQIADELKCGASTISSIERGILNVSEEKRIAYARTVGMGSLFGIVEEAEKRINRLRHKLEIIEEIVFANPKEALKKLAHLSKTEKVDYIGVLRPFVHYLKGRAYYILKNWDNAKKYFLFCLESMTKYPELEETNLKSACYNDLSIVEHQQGNYEEALNLTRLGIANFLDDGERTFYKSLLLLNQCVYLDELKLHEETFRSLETLHHYVSTCKEKEEIRTSLRIKMYFLYATTLDKLKMPNKALEYADLGEKIAKRNHDLDNLFLLWSQIGSIYLKMGKTESAEEFFYKALDLQPNIERQNLTPYAFKDFATLLMSKNEWTFAKEIIELCITISQTHQDERDLAESLVNLARWHMKQEHYQEAINIFLKAQSIIGKHPSILPYLDPSADLCFCFNQIDDKEQFQLYLEKFYWSWYKQLKT
jgi:tetratricopeptide (TPR) repeat protein